MPACLGWGERAGLWLRYLNRRWEFNKGYAETEIFKRIFILDAGMDSRREPSRLPPFGSIDPGLRAANGI